MAVFVLMLFVDLGMSNTVHYYVHEINIITDHSFLEFYDKEPITAEDYVLLQIRDVVEATGRSLDGENGVQIAGLRGSNFGADIDIDGDVITITGVKHLRHVSTQNIVTRTVMQIFSIP